MQDTLDTLLQRHCEKYADRVAVQYQGDVLSYGDLGRQANRLAAGLRDIGVTSDDRVALMQSNRLEYVVSNLAVPKAGGIWVPLNDMLSVEDVQYILSDSDAQYAIVGPSFIPYLEDIAIGETALEQIITVGQRWSHDAVDTTSFAEILEQNNSTPPAIDNDPDDVAAQYYTGGTTGKPKGVLHTHENFVLDLYSHIIELDIQSEQMLLMTPLPHSAGLFLLSGLLRGGTHIITQGFEPQTALELIESNNITWTFMVPTMIYRLLDDEKRGEFDTSSLETLTYGAAPMTPERIREGIDAFGPIFQQFYGQTEVPNLITTLSKSAHTSAIEAGNEELLSSAGLPTTMADVMIGDPDTAQPVDDGDIGMIYASAPYAMKGYYERPEKNEEVFVDRWVKTGDIGRKGEQGYIYLLDRDSDMIISGGMNVYSTKVEEVIEQHDQVAQCAVIGIPDDEWGEAVHAIIIPYDDEKIDQTEIVTQSRSDLADYEVPKSLEVREFLPETPYGKIDKQALREEYWEDEDRKVN